MSDDDTELTDEDRAAAISWYHALIEDRAHRGRLHYTMPDVTGMPPRNSFQLPRDVISKLGDGDPKVGGAVIHQLFGIEDDPADPTRIHGDVVRLIGAGNLNAGRRILERFIQRVRQGAQSHDDYLQPDGSRPARVIR